MVNTIFSSIEKSKARARGLKESSKDKSRSPEERKYLSEASFSKTKYRGQKMKCFLANTQQRFLGGEIIK